MVGIYKITNLITNDCYVGKSKHIEKRWKEHFCRGYGAIHSKQFQTDIEEYGINGFSFRVIEECEEHELQEREKYWIERLKPKYNTVMVGHPVSQETRQKISRKLTGRTLSKEHVEKIRNGIRSRNMIIPQTNAGHRKRVAMQAEIIMEFESVKALAEYLDVDASTVTKALKRQGKVKGKKVWYVV